MHKKKLAVVLDSFGIGGIPKVCNLFMANLIEYYDITLFLKTDKGELYKDIPSGVKKVFVTSDNVKTLILKDLKRFKIFSAISFFFKVLKNKKNIVLCDEIVNKKRGLVTEEEFDAVFAYHGMNLWNLTFSLYRLKGKKKIAWIHGDHPYKGDEIDSMAKVYSQYDLLFCVSDRTRLKYIEDFHLPDNKLEVYYNYIDSQDIINKSNAFVAELAKDTVNIVTVGRISREKGQILIPEILCDILNKDIKVKWYLVGDGDDRANVEDMAKEKGVDENLIFTGNQYNPFPYIKGCDIYVQPSFTEGYCTTICEAAILGKAIVATKICSVKEFEGRDVAVLVPPVPSDLADAIVSLVKNPKRKKSLEDGIRQLDFSHKQEIEKILEYV